MKSALLSKIAMCVCPPAIVATTAVTVPPVRRAVHHLTAPAHAPAPVRPRRVFNAAYDCTPTAVPLTSAPSALTAVAPADAVAPAAYPATPIAFTGFGAAYLPGAPVAGPLLTGGTPVTQPTPTATVPEVSTWAMTITGLGAVGWALRRRPRALEMA